MPTDLPYFAQGNDDVADALHIASQPKVRYDEGPQPGEPTITPREVPLSEKVASYFMGDARPTPERRRVAESIGSLAGLLPTDPSVAAGEAVKQFTSGHPIDAFETMYGAMPQTGMLKGYQRQLTPMGLYSHAAEAAANLPQAKGTYEQMMAMLRKQGVRDEELRWAGVQEALGNKPVVTQEELAKHFHEKLPQLQETTLRDASAQEEQLANSLARDIHGRPYDDLTPEEQDDVALAMMGAVGDEPKYAQYVLPGGENYREVVLQHPGAGYQSSHWDGIDSPVAHLRMADRTGPDGEKILHVEELQSDWAKEGQKKGFANPQPWTPVDPSTIRVEYASYPNSNRGQWTSYDKNTGEALFVHPSSMTEDEAIRDAARLVDADRKYKAESVTVDRNGLKITSAGVPSAPYVAGGKNDWLDLALKRALREAAAGGYDKMVWTPGEAQAARYDLSKQIKSLSWDPTSKSLMAYGHNAEKVLNVTVSKEEDIADYVGKDVADKLVNKPSEKVKDFNGNETYLLHNQDIKVGGEGMKTFYDKVVPSQLSKILKKLDPEVKVGQGIVHGAGDDRQIKEIYGTFGFDEDTPVEDALYFLEEGGHPDSADRLRKLLENVELHHPVHSIPITPRMREEILKGLPAYAAGGAVTDPVEDALRLAHSHQGSRK